jgi:hypothetical protein
MPGIVLDLRPNFVSVSSKKNVSTKEYKCPAKIFSSKNISYYAQLNYLTPKTQESNEVDKA